MKFVVDRVNIKQDIAIYKLENLSEMYGLPDTSSGLLCISQKILKYFEWLYVVQYRPDKHQT